MISILLESCNLEQSGYVLSRRTLEVQDDFTVNVGKGDWPKFTAVNAVGVAAFEPILLKLGINP